MQGEQPAGWPGQVILEGRTLVHLPENLGVGRENEAGPGDRSEREVFHNRAMAANRTRSVLLLAHEMREGIFSGEKPVRMLDALAASGIRGMRIANELPDDLAARLELNLCDMDENAHAWQIANSNSDVNGEIMTTRLKEFNPILGDARQVALSRGWQWVDIDPFGSPIPFLDSVMQSLARKSVLEVTATDVAALTGSSPPPLMRRYGARARLDEIAHDTGLRILLANIARCAARHDRIIEPLISVWDSHHVRVSVRVRKSLDSASIVEENLGWRIADPTDEEAGQMAGHAHILVPISHAVHGSDKRISGPLWTGPLGDESAMSSMTEERALELCSPDSGLVSDETELRLRLRAMCRAVRHISEEASLASKPGLKVRLIVVDLLASRLNLPAPPSPAKLVDALKELGYCAAIAAYGKPAIRTDAEMDGIKTALRNLSD